MSRLRPRSLLPISSSMRVPRRQQRSTSLRRLARHTPAFEISARLGVSVVLALVAAASLGRLIPHLQGQVQQLEAARAELTQAEAANTRLRSDFDRSFDPAQAERVIQEQTGYRSRLERPVVWTD
ncbi:MAG: hypothetical protein WBG38_19040 [Nodosilinea sp.]